MSEPLLEVENVSKQFRVQRPLLERVARRPRQYLQAVNDVSLAIQPGEAFGLVGESGCGKTTLGRIIVRLTTPDSGSIRFRGKDLNQLDTRDRRAVRSRIQMIFQDPHSSLNPRVTVGAAIGEALHFHGIVPRSSVRGEVSRLLEQVGLAASTAARYPHELSGGQRQRVSIARALSVRPELLVADEAVSGLDVSIRAQVLNLLAGLREQLGLTLIFISHDLSLVEFLCDRVGVMYLGRLVELGPADELFGRSGHPYTRGLINAVPAPDPQVRAKEAAVGGEMPSPIDPPSGCHFRTRCPVAQPICVQTPEPAKLGEGHWARCFFAERIAESEPKLERAVGDDR